jgi:hypothetical protein
MDWHIFGQKLRFACQDFCITLSGSHYYIIIRIFPSQWKKIAFFYKNIDFFPWADRDLPLLPFRDRQP